MAPKQSLKPAGKVSTTSSTPTAWDPTTDSRFDEQKKAVLHTLYPKYGVRAVIVKGYHNSHHKMAGYANMDTAGDLTSFCAKDHGSNGPIRQACKHLKAGFGCVGGETAKWDVESFLVWLYQFNAPSALQTRNNCEDEIMSNLLPLDEEEYSVMDKDHGWLSMAICLYNMFEEYGDQFPKYAGSKFYTNENQIILGRHAEDWHFWYTLLRYYRHGFLDQFEKQQADGKNRGRSNAPAGFVYYITDEDLTGPTDIAATQLAENVEQSNKFDELEEMLDMEEMADMNELTIADLLNNAEVLERRLTDRTLNPDQIAHGEVLAKESVSLTLQITCQDLCQFIREPGVLRALTRGKPPGSLGLTLSPRINTRKNLLVPWV
jgi:hypothetical protein